MGLGRKELLETALFDSEQPVTVGYLSRHADISIDDATKELQSFYDENKNKAELNAVYLLSGEEKQVDDSGDGSQFKPAQCYKTQLVAQSQLDDAKNQFSTIDTCQVFALHTKPIKSLCSLYNIDRSEDDKFIETDHKRGWIVCPDAEIKRALMLKQHPQPSKTAKAESPVEPVSHASTSKSVTHKNTRKNDIGALFAKANAKPKPSTPKKEVDESSLSSCKSADKANDTEQKTISPPIKHRGNRILVDNEDMDEVQEMNRETKDKAISRQRSKDKSAKKQWQRKGAKQSLKKTKPLLLSDDDIFSNGDSSPERMNVEENESQEEPVLSLPSKKRRTSPRRADLEQDDKLHVTRTERASASSPSNRKATRKEYVTETFVDDDGFMVTKQVLKDVEVTTKPEDNSAKPLTPMRVQNKEKTEQVKGATTKRVPHGQSKISSFFTKK